MTTGPVGTRDVGHATVWDGVDRLIDASPSLRDLQAHGLHLLAARRRRALGLLVPSDLAWAELWAAFRVNAARTLLERIRAACDGPIILIKGLAVATAYPDPAVRPFLDLDILVADPTAAQAALIAAGFSPVQARMHPETLHHLHPLELPGSPLSVELHRHPKWLAGSKAPSFEDLVAGSMAATIGVDGILMLRPAHHALVLTAHLWTSDPSARLLRFLDVALLAESAPPEELSRLLDAWEMRRPWGVTMSVADAVFRDSKEPLSVRLWARNLRIAREPTVVEMHLARLLAPFFVLHPGLALQAAGKAAAGLFRPQPYEGWRAKLKRTARQLRHPSMRRSQHGRDVSANVMDPAPPRSARAATDVSASGDRSQELEL